MAPSAAGSSLLRAALACCCRPGTRWRSAAKPYQQAAWDYAAAAAAVRDAAEDDFAVVAVGTVLVAAALAGTVLAAAALAGAGDADDRDSVVVEAAAEQIAAPVGVEVVSRSATRGGVLAAAASRQAEAVSPVSVPREPLPLAPARVQAKAQSVAGGYWPRHRHLRVAHEAAAQTAAPRGAKCARASKSVKATSVLSI